MRKGKKKEEKMENFFKDVTFLTLLFLDWKKSTPKNLLVKG